MQYSQYQQPSCSRHSRTQSYQHHYQAYPTPQVQARQPPPQGYFPPPPGPPPGFTQGQSQKAGPSNNANRVISAEEDIERLLHVCKSGKGNANLLYEALVYAKPDDLKEKGIIQEFLAKCRSSQDLVFSQIPWATTQAERSRRKAKSKKETKEERLLAELLGTNEELLEAIQMYTNLERVGIEQGDMERVLADQKLRSLEAITSFQPTRAESALIDQIFEMADTRRIGSISSHAAVKIFSGSRLSPTVLADIWRIANVEESEMLSRQVVGVAVRLIGHAQANAGKKVEEGWVLLQGATATIQGLEPTGHHNESVAGPSSSSSSIGNLPPLSAEDRTKFMKIFMSSQPEHGALNGNRAREVLIKSKLPMQTLGQIWELADVHKRGYLDAPAFVVAMYLVQGSMAGSIKNLPQSLPPSLYLDASPLSPADTMSPMSPTSTSFLTPPIAGPSSSSRAYGWDVSNEEKDTSDAFFGALDEHSKGYLEGKVARAHFLQSGMSEQDVKQIWSLVDFNGNGRLGQDEFAVALHLIQARQNAVPVPKTLPESLIPPRLRKPVVQEESLIDLAESTSLSSIPPLQPTPTGLPLSPTSPAGPLTTTFTGGTTSSLLAGLPSTSRQFLAPPDGFSGYNSRPSRVVSAPATRPPTTNPSPLLAVGGSGSVSQPHLLLPTSPTAMSMPSPPSIQADNTIPAGWTWDVTPVEKATSDRYFDMLDPWKHGYIEGEAAVPFMSKSKLSESILAKIWDLADSDTDGRLSREDFAVAMHLIKAKIAGREVPDTLPLSLVPPSPAGREAPVIEEASPFDDPPPEQISMPVPMPAPPPPLPARRANDAEGDLPPPPPPPREEQVEAEPEGSDEPPPAYSLVDDGASVDS
ncbi:hypothetical protein EUX98_g2439 [Antrodiella citrinella]|uniref:Uncharacterized protein n=1 Tax=Antrodiella citrinella TaxID=2447956 RepID=A0A4S4N1X5_9APHY|nr:hypothetical protein EUX98_g2439 [Antrodiella citrinella]